MALLAEEIVEEWLNRQGYFTIRGINLGVHEIDLLAIRICDGIIECRHLEVTASIRPMSYITPLAKSIQKATGRPSMSPKHRSSEELQMGVKEWVDKKYNLQRKAELRERLHPGDWSFELVVHKIVHPEELDLIKDSGINIYHLKDIVNDLANKNMVIRSASGASLVDLILLDVG